MLGIDIDARGRTPFKPRVLLCSHPPHQDKGGSNSNIMELEKNDRKYQTIEATQGGYNATNRRQLRAIKPQNEKGHEPNKFNLSKNPVLVEVNENLQPGKWNKTDKLSIWMKTHVPNKGSKLDVASSMAKQTTETELTQIEEGSCDIAAWDESFKNIIGDDKYSYAKTYAMGVKVLCSNSERCALQEERAKKVKIDRNTTKSRENSEIREN